MSNTYQQLAAEAQDATDYADVRPTETNHRKAAQAHLAASVRAQTLGKQAESEMHDAKADEHIAQMKACASSAA